MTDQLRIVAGEVFMAQGEHLGEPGPRDLAVDRTRPNKEKLVRVHCLRERARSRPLTLFTFQSSLLRPLWRRFDCNPASNPRLPTQPYTTTTAPERAPLSQVVGEGVQTSVL